jgi:rhodanese-related sulfurtransferase
MNDGKADQEAGMETGSRVAWQAVGILLAACVLGLVYNHTSPLGVRPPVLDEAPIQPALNRTPESAASTSQTNPSVVHASSAIGVTNLPGWEPILPPLPAPALPPSNNLPVQTTQLKFPELKWPAVKALLAAGQIVLIDARLKETYELSRIPGSVSLPAYSPVEALQAFVARYPQETRFVIYCNSATCDMSHELAGKLARQFGYTNLTLMPGGFAEYVIAESGTGNP